VSAIILAKIPTVKFHKKLFSGSREVPCRKADLRTDGHDDASNLFPLCEGSKEWTIAPELCTMSTFLTCAWILWTPRRMFGFHESCEIVLPVV